MKRRYYGMDACWYDDEDDAFDRTRAYVIRWVPRSLAFIFATAALLYACTPASADTAGPWEMAPITCGIYEGPSVWGLMQPPSPPLPVREMILREPEPPIRVTPHVPYIPGGNDPHIPAPVSLPAAGVLFTLAIGSLALLRRKA